MNLRLTEVNEVPIAIVNEPRFVLTDEQSAVNFMVTIKEKTGCHCATLNKEAIAETFYELSSGLAGGLLPKFMASHFKLAIIGDFSNEQNKALRDFVDECNKGQRIRFTASEDEAFEFLTQK